MNSKKDIIRTALYLRLSDEDRNKLNTTQISESIKNQERLLRDFAKEHNFSVIEVYNDEDWSGSDDTRPAFNKMINECKLGNIDVVLCKTQARFARDLELIEKYIHNLFHEWNVRFVSIVDRIDNNKKETKKTSQLTAMTDQWYLEDTSLNIRTTLNNKRKAGLCTASFSTYGFRKDPKNKNHLIIDNIASEVVKRIYDEYLMGYGLEKIANNLNCDKILSPYEYKILNGCNLKIPLLKNYLSYNYIEKTGNYILDINFINNEEYILRNLIIFIYLDDGNNGFDSKVDVFLRYFDKQTTDVYYSEKNMPNINIISKNSLRIFNINECLPKTAKAIIVTTKFLDRTHTFNCQFEIILKENRNQKKYFIKCISDSTHILKKSKIQYNIRKKFKWSAQTIKKILSDEVYIGNLVQFKTTTLSYKNHTIIYNDEDERIRKDNTHEAIIEKEMWYRVKKRMSKKERSCLNGEINIFSNKVFCEKCNRVFGKCGNNKNGGYLCCKDKKNKWTNCDNKSYLRISDLYELILEKFNNLLKRYYNAEYIENMYDNKLKNDVIKNKLETLKKELNLIQKKLEEKSSFLLRLYEDRIKELLPEKEFLTLLSKYKNETCKLEERENVIKHQMEMISERKSQLINKDVFDKYKKINSLNIEIIDIFIDRIIVGSYNRKRNIREIQIFWNFKN